MSIQTFPMNVFPQHQNNVIVVQPGEDAVLGSCTGGRWYDHPDGDIFSASFDPETYWFEIPTKQRNEIVEIGFPNFPLDVVPGDGFISVLVFPKTEKSCETHIVAIRGEGQWKEYPTGKDITEQVGKAKFWFFYKDLQGYMIAKRQQAKKEKTC